MQISDILKQVITKQWGFITAPQLAEVAKSFPQMPFVLRWSGKPREIKEAQHVATRIHHVEKILQEDFLRDVFIEAKQMDHLRQDLGLPEHLDKQQIINA